MKNKFWMENIKTIIACAVAGLIYWKFYSEPEPPYHPSGQFNPNHVRTGDFQPPQQPGGARVEEASKAKTES